MAFALPELGYANNALTPYIDELTMEIHRGKHHNAYVTNLNAAVMRRWTERRWRSCWKTIWPSCRRPRRRRFATTAAGI